MWAKLSKVSLLSLVVLLSGCAGVSGKFTPVDKVNLEPFAAVTINMVNSVDYGLDRNSSILTKPYLSPVDKPGYQQLMKSDAELYGILQNVVAYSIKLVSLSQSNRTQKEKVVAFADYIEKLDKPALKFHLEAGNLKEEDLLDMVPAIRRQEDLLDAMKVAQPLIDYMLLYVDSVTERIRHLEIQAEDEIEKEIDNDYAMENAYVEVLHERRDVAVKALILINEQYMGRTNALDELNDGQLIARTGVEPRRVTDANVHELEQDLVKRLSEIQAQLNLVDQDINKYEQTLRELDELVSFHDQEIRKAKGIVQLWAGAHSKMASGISDPADWFDVTDPGSELFSLVKATISRRR